MKKLSCKLSLIVSFCLTASCSLEKSPDCLDGQIVRGEDADHVILRCTASEWKEEKCDFGIEESGNDLRCVDPCLICKKTNGEAVECGLIYDGAKYYSCNRKTGWSVDNSCFNDLVRNTDTIINSNSFSLSDKSVIGLLSENHTALSLDLKSIPESNGGMGDNNAAGGFGKCGECNQDEDPEYCIESENQKVYHRCHEGQWRISPFGEISTCGDNTTQCKDEYGQAIWVNPENNRYHCGSCDNACSQSQRCQDGSCVFKFTCDENNYSTVQIGPRTIKAYCIHTKEDFKAMADQINQGQAYGDKNYDNAYVIMNDLVLEDEWIPIGKGKDNAFSGIIFGNSKTITLSGGIAKSEYMGLFGYVKGAHIEHLSIASGDQEMVVMNIPRSDSFYSYYGLLAGKIDASTIENIQLSNEKIMIEYEDSEFDGMAGNDENKPAIGLALGGLAGEMENVKIKDCTLNNISLSVIMNMQHLNEKTIDKPNSFAHYGILAGRTIKTNDEDESSSIENIIINKKSDKAQNENTSLISLDYGYKSREKPGTNFDTRLGVGGLVGFSDNSMIRNNRVNNITIAPVNVGVNITFLAGLIGYVRKSTIDGNTVDTISIHNEENNGSGIGGLVGGTNDSQQMLNTIETVISNNRVSSVNYSFKSGYNWGGAVGLSYNTKISSTNVDKVSYIITPSMATSSKNNISSELGGIVGWGNNSTEVSDCHVKDIEIKQVNNTSVDGLYNIGGLVGRLSSSSFVLGCGVDGILINVFAGNSFGGLIGSLENSNVLQSYVDNNIEQDKDDKSITCVSENHIANDCTNIGGLIGRAEVGTVTDSNVNYFSMFGAGYLGGIIGYADSVIISHAEVGSYICYSGNRNFGGIGGLSGYIKDSTIRNSKVTGVQLFSKASEAGCLAGSAHGGVISGVKSSCMITTNADAGGIVAFSKGISIDHTLALSKMTITGDKGQSIGGAIGLNVNDAMMESVVSLSDVTINSKIMQQSAMSLGGMLGTMGKSNYSVYNTFNVMGVLPGNDINNLYYLGEFLGRFLPAAQTEGSAAIVVNNIYSRFNSFIKNNNIMFVPFNLSTITDGAVSALENLSLKIDNYYSNYPSCNSNPLIPMLCNGDSCYVRFECGQSNLNWLDMNSHVCFVDSVLSSESNSGKNPEYCLLPSSGGPSSCNGTKGFNVSSRSCLVSGSSTWVPTKEAFGNYKCYFSKFEKFTGLKDNEFTELKKALCGDNAGACEEVALPFPKGVNPDWCEEDI